MREVEPLTRDMRDSIKAASPWAILLFSGLYFIFIFIRLRKTFETNRTNETNKTFNPQSIFLNISQYVLMLTLYGVLINVFFFSKGRDILIPFNLSLFYSVILFTILSGLGRFFYSESLTSNIQPLTSKAQDWLPPIAYRFLLNNLPKAQAYIKERPSAPFIIAFMALLIICAFLLIFEHENTAERAANIAYFLLVIGVGMEIYQLIKYGERDEKE